jgi:hypothetical protein
MCNKVLLMLLAIGGLLFFSPSSFAATKNNPKITNLSRTITELSNLPAGNESLVASAIKRALLVKEMTGTHHKSDSRDLQKRDDVVDTVNQQPNILGSTTGNTTTNSVSGRTRNRR